MTAILLDIDGVLHVSGEAIPGAADAVRALRDKGHRLRFVTNNTTRARAQLADELRAIGIELEDEELATTPLAAGRLLEGLRVLPVTMEAIKDDLAEHMTLVDEGAEGVLVRTGKFRPAALREADPQPDGVIDSIADLPEYLAA